ncbi:MAG TPA: hypothetical protein VK671_00765 [Mucilaginibacter sp.]|jgi:hypothetical protein|nr:hypothetical protein [Mucilaginibacter sp.]
MKRFILNVFGILLFAGVANGQSAGNGNDFTPLPKPKQGKQSLLLVVVVFGA